MEGFWDEVVAGPQPEYGLGDLKKKFTTKPLIIKDVEGEGSRCQRSLSMPATPGTPGTPVTPTTPLSARKENVWRSVLRPGSNLATKSIGSQVVNKPLSTSPTVYDLLYSGETRSK
ncbi:hypothetical protein ELE71_30375, partial [Klebsiella pneumoniae]|nr:hypothetical protein [Klebsiella pneumoniae]